MYSGIKSIEINPDWFYHKVTGNNIEQFILSGSIRAKRYFTEKQKIKSESFSNGSYYICLAKYDKELEKSYNSCYKAFIKGQYAFVIDGVDAIKTKFIENEDSSLYKFLNKLPMKKRYSCWEDEYQVKKEISLDKVIGIKIPNRIPWFSSVAPAYIDKNRGIDFFLKKMESVGGDFPFIDIEEKKMIEKKKIKEYIKGMIK